MMNARILCLVTFLTYSFGAGCRVNYKQPPKASSGVSQASVKVPTGSDGITVEQRNIANRLQEDNKSGAIKHLYIISAYSGQVILYSTVQGKVTSSKKRLSPRTVNSGCNGSSCWYGIPVNIGGVDHYTNEVLEDDGTYGESGEYFYWWDVRGQYYQYYITGGAIPFVSSTPIAFPHIIMNMEMQGGQDAAASPTSAPNVK